MKIAILGDCHLGARNDSPIFHAAFKKFYSDVFFKELEARNINTVIQLGDLWDRRKYINFQTLAYSKEYFFEPLKAKNINMVTLLGNHDVTYKNTLEVNSSILLLKEYDNITVIKNPQTLEFDETSICFIPWICADNADECKSEMTKTKAEICVGHLEIAGFEMYRGHPSDEGTSSSEFSKFDMVFSGHFHHRSTKGNIWYLGTPYEMTWQDYADQKGFHIFDTETRSLEFIPNPYSSFCRLEYDDKDKEIQKLENLDLEGMFVKVVVLNKTDYYKFDSFINELSTKGCADIKIVENLAEFQDGEIDDNIDLEDTQNILSNYIDSLETDIDKDKVKKFMKTLYVEALNVEIV